MGSKFSTHFPNLSTSDRHNPSTAILNPYLNIVSTIIIATMTDSATDKPKKSGFGPKVASLFRSPAKEAYNKVLAESVDEANSGWDDKTTNMSDKEKVRALVRERDEASPSGSFVLGTYKPLGASQGYAGYYSAKGATSG
jgi:hypothetical protein